MSLYKVDHVQSAAFRKDKSRCPLPPTLTAMRVTTVFCALFIALVMVEGSESGIKPTSWDSPVIISQTQLGNRSSTFKKAVSGRLVNNYTFSSAPVYREGYPLYRYYVAFLKYKAARISNEEEKLLNDGGNLCMGEAAEKRTLQGGIHGNLVTFFRTVKIDGGMAMTWPTAIDGTFSIFANKTQTFELTIRAQYNTSIVTGTTCTQVETKVKGAMVTLYEKNPNATSPPPTNQTQPTDKSNPTNLTITVASPSNKMLPLPAFIALFALMNMFCY